MQTTLLRTTYAEQRRRRTNYEERLREIENSDWEKRELRTRVHARICNMPQVKQLKSLQDCCLDNIADKVSKSYNYDDVERVEIFDFLCGPFIDILRKLAVLGWIFTLFAKFI